MFKRSWPAAILAGGLLATMAAPPLHATEESNFEVRTARISRGVEIPRTPGDRAPIATPTGDDDMPDNTLRPPRGPIPVAESVHESGTGRSKWLRSMWERWAEFRSLRFTRF